MRETEIWENKSENLFQEFSGGAQFAGGSTWILVQFAA